MVARDLISDAIPPLNLRDTGSKALKWMDEFRVNHLPVVEKKEYLGLISEDDIFNLNKPEEPMSSHQLAVARPFVYEEQHIYEAIKLTSKLNLTNLPVLNAQKEYVGCLTPADLVRGLASIAAIEGAGGIVVLELNVRDYSLNEISRIVESNDARILSLYISSKPESNKLELTMKIDKMDLTRILASFYRFNYVVKATFHESEFIEDVKARYDSLMNYLNI